MYGRCTDSCQEVAINPQCHRRVLAPHYNLELFQTNARGDQFRREVVAKTVEGSADDSLRSAPAPGPIPAASGWTVALGGQPPCRAPMCGLVPADRTAGELPGPVPLVRPLKCTRQALLALPSGRVQSRPVIVAMSPKHLEKFVCARQEPWLSLGLGPRVEGR